MVVHGVHHVFHPPVQLNRWPSGAACFLLTCMTL